jgi:hypothetical protein
MLPDTDGQRPSSRTVSALVRQSAMAADDSRRARSEDRRQFIGGSDVRRKPIRSFILY